MIRRCGKVDAILLAASLLPLFAAGGCRFCAWVSLMSFSPDGRHLAVAAAERESSSQAKDRSVERFVFRLWVISNRRKTRVVEETPRATDADYALFAPAYSPDGRELCYLRLGPIPREPTTRPAKPASGPASSARPEKEGSGEDDEARGVLFQAPLVLVIRDAKTDAILCTIPIPRPPEPPSAANQGPPRRPAAEDEDVPDAGRSYDSGLPAPIDPMSWQAQYGPHGQRIFLCYAGLAMAVDRGTRRVTVLSDKAWRMQLSPDGKTLATLGRDSSGQVILGFVPTDGGPARYRRMRSKGARDIAWKDSRMLLVLRIRDLRPAEPSGKGTDE